MKTIWKWTLQPETTIAVPRGAEILTVQAQHNEPQIWMLVDPNAETEERTFQIHGTGHDIPDAPGKYIGTFQLRGGALVLHAFETGTTGRKV
jgi:hypothetical protein